MPPSQSINFYHALKAGYASVEGRDVGDKKVEILIFEGEGHSLDGVEAAKASFDAIREWLDRAGSR